MWLHPALDATRTPLIKIFFHWFTNGTHHMTQHTLTSAAIALALATPALALEPADVLGTYADIAAANYEDSLITAQRLQAAVDALVADPSAENLTAARTAWLAARVPYQQTEVFRFGTAIVDDWEGKVNAWPLDEGLIDYVDASSGGPSPSNFSTGGRI